MKKSLSLLFAFPTVLHPNIVNAQSESEKGQVGINSISSLRITGPGSEIYICLLRYRDSVTLDMAPLPRQRQYATVNNYRHVGHDFGKPVMMKIPKDKISKNDLLDLVSNYKFEFSNGFLYKEFFPPDEQKQANNDHNFHLIDPHPGNPLYPSFLSFKVQKISLSD